MKKILTLAAAVTISAAAAYALDILVLPLFGILCVMLSSLNYETKNQSQA